MSPVIAGDVANLINALADHLPGILMSSNPNDRP
jgi:hypothetical protein